MKKLKIAVVGATGNVGREILNILDSNTSEITEFMIKNLERNNLSLGL